MSKRRKAQGSSCETREPGRAALIRLHREKGCSQELKKGKAIRRKLLEKN